MAQARKAEYPPWYRHKNYKGKMTERQKKVLDSFRLDEEHPAATYDTLPEEVQNYINALEMQVYDAKQSGLFWGCAFVSFLGAFSIQRWWQYPDDYGHATMIVGAITCIGAWVVWYFQQKKNAREFLPDDDPGRPTNEAMKMHWEINYLGSLRERDQDGKPDWRR